MSGFKSDFLRTLSERGFIHQISDESGLDELLAKETVTAYIGFDPTAPESPRWQSDPDHDAALVPADRPQGHSPYGRRYRHGWRSILQG